MKKIKIKLTKKSAEELADLLIKLGFAYKGEKDILVKIARKERECLLK
jgi:hypothetical protein